jgi:uncharacterized GH25 family protein
MLKKSALVLVSLLFVAVWLNAHDMYLKLTSFYLAPNQKATIALYNGTFDKSENVITRDRMLDVSLVGPMEQREKQESSQWRESGTTTLLDIKTGAPGTYVFGVSTKARTIELTAQEFNEYLSHDGVLDVLAERKKEGILDEEATELYSKHVKTVIQVGDRRTDAFKIILGYPIEIVPLQNPYSLSAGDSLDVQVLFQGKPVANELVYASYGGFHAHDDAGGHAHAVNARTDSDGIARIPLEKNGHWFVRLIHMEKSGEEGINYESNWATLTFEVK